MSNIDKATLSLEPCVDNQIHVNILENRIAEQEAVISGLRKNAAFYRCCALSGEIPAEGSEPYQESTP